MDRSYQIYQAEEDQIPEEDKARLDGYLKGRADEALLTAVDEYKKRFQEIIENKNIGGEG